MVRLTKAGKDIGGDTYYAYAGFCIRRKRWDMGRPNEWEICTKLYGGKVVTRCPTLKDVREYFEREKTRG